VDQSKAATTPDPDPALDLDDVPAGDHALEVAARGGFGPLSPVAKRVWHGGGIPCVTCGQLVRRGADHCEHCGQDLSEDMVEKMRAHSGPWYVLEHLRPFPGVALDRIVRQIRRGLITETSIIRGPSTDYQWRFAVESPGLCRYFGKCWQCHHEIAPSDAFCRNCLSHLSFERTRPISEPRPPIPTPSVAPVAGAGDGHRVNQPRTTVLSHPEPRASARATAVSVPSVPIAAQPAPVVHSGPRATASVVAPGSELAKLANVVQRFDVIPANPDSSRIGPVAATWIAVGVLVVALIVVAWLASVRGPNVRPSPPAPSGLVAPSSP